MKNDVFITQKNEYDGFDLEEIQSKILDKMDIHDCIITEKELIDMFLSEPNGLLEVIEHLPECVQKAFQNFLDLIDQEDIEGIENLRFYGFDCLNIPEDLMDIDPKDCSYKSDFLNY